MISYVISMIFRTKSRSCAGKRNGLYEKNGIQYISTTYGIKIKIKNSNTIIGDNTCFIINRMIKKRNNEKNFINKIIS